MFLVTNLTTLVSANIYERKKYLYYTLLNGTKINQSKMSGLVSDLHLLNVKDHDKKLLIR